MRPILFEVFGLSVPAYSFFVMLGLAVGGFIFFIEARRKKMLNENFFFLFLAGLFGGILGAKLPIWIYHYKEIIAGFSNINLILSGRTVVGGIIGGWVAVEIVKRKLGIKYRTGDLFAPALALGEAIGRIGCFLRGCCYGIATSLPWGVNFGDGILRHPTQIYSAIFNLGLFFYLWLVRKKVKNEGDLFQRYLIIYFTFRFFIEFIRVSPKVIFGLTGFQLAAIGIIVYTLIRGSRTKQTINNY